MPKKINLNKSDTLKDIVDQIVNEPSDHITLVIPNFSLLAEAATNFKVLKKLAEATDKTLVIESVDDQVVQLSKDVNLEASNPFFANRPRRWEDIEATLAVKKNIKERSKDEAKEDEEDLFEPSKKRKIQFRFKKGYWIALSVVLVVLIPAYWLAFSVLPRAEIEIVTKKSDWQFNDLVTIKKDSAIASEVFRQKKNAQMNFPASGKKTINKKATGRIVVYNAYSSEPQKVVATTRFAAPDGKIVRLVKDLVIPGAKIENSQIVASSIETEVIADKSGPEYNLGPTAKLTIPGFKGTPKYNGFYGEIKESLKGGVAGMVPYPTDTDIKAAQSKVAQVLEDAISSELVAQLPANFKVADGAKKFTLLKYDIDPNVNDRGEFSMVAEGEIAIIGFKGKEALSFLRAQMRSALDPEYDFKTYDLKYGIAKADFKEEKISLPLDFKAIVEKPINIDELRRRIAGKSEEELKAIIFSLPGLASATVNLWPFYVNSIPMNAGPEKVKISVK